MEENYTLTVIEDAAVPLAAAPGGGIPVEHMLFIIALLCVMAGCAVYFLHRYLEECRQLRLRLAQLQQEAIVVTPSYEDMPEDTMEGRFNRRILTEAVRQAEDEKLRDVMQRMRSG